ncbi:MAG: cysteine--tRNA ligase [Weeksellaceae bacterium]
MHLYDTLSKSVKILPPPTEQKLIKLYTCGPTVYDFTHIGHMRKYSMDDLLKRSLKYLGYDVKHVMNITDVGHLSGDDDSGEDKLEKGAKKYGKSVWDVAAEYTTFFMDTMHAIGVQDADMTLKATNYISQMIELIEKLDKKGFTYETDEAVYFDTTKFPTYGQLSGQKLEDKLQGARDDVHIDAQKKNPADFALWFKRVGRFADHTMHWPSPWGDGFPGWHIECSAISMSAFDSPTIDIHTGGIDHIPVHHENEIAQSEAATGETFVKWWVHYAFLNVEGEKMSKSKGNFYTIKDLQEKQIDPMAVRYLFLQTHYRKGLNFTWEAVKAADEALKNLRATYARLENDDSATTSNVKTYRQRFSNALGDDLNTAQALAVLWEVLKSDLSDEDKMTLSQEFDIVFGLGFTQTATIDIPDEITQLAQKREAARKNKDFQTSDDLRSQIAKAGYEVEDTAAGFTLKKTS